MATEIQNGFAEQNVELSIPTNTSLGSMVIFIPENKYIIGLTNNLQKCHQLKADIRAGIGKKKGELQQLILTKSAENRFTTRYRKSFQKKLQTLCVESK